MSDYGLAARPQAAARAHRGAEGQRLVDRPKAHPIARALMTGICECDCGRRTRIATATNTRKGHVRGQHVRFIRGHSGPRSHGLTGHPLYKTWRNMRDRCRDPHRPDYSRYGGRGIAVCEEWNDFAVFLAYVEVLEHYGEPGRTLDRIDNDGNYGPGNVRWATKSEQSINSDTRVGVSGYRGVYRDRGKWRASITRHGVRFHLGNFDTAEEAAAAAGDWRRRHTNEGRA
jgi:hypothetical protein